MDPIGENDRTEKQMKTENDPHPTDRRGAKCATTFIHSIFFHHLCLKNSSKAIKILNRKMAN